MPRSDLPLPTAASTRIMVVMISGRNRRLRELIAQKNVQMPAAVSAARRVAEFEAAGASGLRLEDQVLPKKCGHLDGKSLIAAEDIAAKLRAAVVARQDKDFLLIARTGARGVTSFDDAVDRAK